MDERTLKALKGSIAKWEGILAGTKQDHATHNCPLCVEFLHPNCRGCPVSEETGNAFCAETPYDAWCYYAYEVAIDPSALDPQDDPKARELAQAELDFLKALLPDDD